MSEPSMLRIEGLELINWMCFEQLGLEPDPEFTLLIGPNASGKTAILEALAVSLGKLLSFLPCAPGNARAAIREAVVRFVHQTTDIYTELVPQYPCTVRATAALSGEHSSWQLTETGRLRQEAPPATDVELRL